MSIKRIDKDKFDKNIFAFAEQFEKNGKEVFLVGGALRDFFLNKSLSHNISDYDFATNARPEEVQKIFKKTIPTGIQHGTVTALFNSSSYEVTTYRSDGIYTDGRHPDSVEFSDTIEEDLARRDFTINAMALNLKSMEVTDPYNGMSDLKKKLIRAVGDPKKRFNEDALRMMRACRFAGQLEFKIEKKTSDAIKDILDNFKNISAERIKDEFIKIMKTRKPSLAIEALRDSGLLKMIMPELLEGFGVEQNEFHKYDIYYHNLYACDAAAPDSYIIRLAALFHDIGKMRSMRNVEKNGKESDTPVFYNHELIGARMTDKILKRLKFSNSDRDMIIHLINNHMFHYTNEWTDGAVRRFMRKVGLENISSVFKLREADRAGNGKKHGPAKSLSRLQKRIDEVIEAENAITVKDLKINGYDIMEAFSLKPGRIIGEILEDLLEQILDDPDKNQKSILLLIVKEILEEQKVIHKIENASF